MAVDTDSKKAEGTKSNPNSSSQNDSGSRGENREKRRKRRWGEKAAGGAAASAGGSAAVSDGAVVAGQQDPAKARVLAMQESIRARLAAAKAKQQQQQSATSSGQDGGTAELDANTAKRARHYDLDLSVTAPTFQSKREQAQPKINPYLAHRQQEEQTKKGKDKNLKAAPASSITVANVESGEAEGGGVVLADKKEALDDDIDFRLERTAKNRQQGRVLTFVEPGHWQEVAQRKREKALKAQESGYVSGRKTGHTIHSASMASVYGRTAGDDEDGYDKDHDELPPRVDANPDTSMPLAMEWWDTALLPGKLKKEVATLEAKLLSQQSKQALQKLDSTSSMVTTGDDTKNPDDANVDNDEAAYDDLRNRCFDQAALAYSKTAALVQHIVPIQPAHKSWASAQQQEQQQQPVLQLTKRELKRQRKLRRQAKQRELQDMQAAGLLPAPEPRLTLKNFIAVLGDQAFLDPSQMEQKVVEQMEARQRSHLERNSANKLTKEQRAEKQARKLQNQDKSAAASGVVSVALFWVADLSHPYHRTKVDLNAQQNNITGGVLECENNPSLAVVICEGGPKAIKRYRRLMEVRMKWTGPDDQPEDDDDDEDEDDELLGDADDEEGEKKPVARKFNPNNQCQLVWQGMAVKRHFKGFVFQSCETADQARKVLKAKGVAHYWDQVLEFHTNRKKRRDNLQLRLADDNDDDDDDDNMNTTAAGDSNPYDDDEEDIIMKDAS